MIPLPDHVKPGDLARHLGVSERGLRTYAHAIEDRTVTDAVFGTNLAQGRKRKSAR